VHEQRPNSEIEEGEDQCDRSSQPTPNREATTILAPFTVAEIERHRVLAAGEPLSHTGLDEEVVAA
jgi:hypothetical protein